MINPPISNFGFDDEDDGSRGPIPREEDYFPMNEKEAREYYAPLLSLSDEDKATYLQMVIDFLVVVEETPEDGMFDLAERAGNFAHDTSTFLGYKE